MEPTVATLAVALKTIIQDRNARITAGAVVSTVSSTDSTVSAFDSTVSSADVQGHLMMEVLLFCGQ